MNDFYKWAALAPRRYTRKQNKRARRKEKLCRKIMVHYAGNALLALSTHAEIVSITAPARDWSTRRSVSVPRRLRAALGRTVGEPETWAKQWRVSVDMGVMVATYSVVKS